MWAAVYQRAIVVVKLKDKSGILKCHFVLAAVYHRAIVIVKDKSEILKCHFVWAAAYQRAIVIVKDKSEILVGCHFVWAAVYHRAIVIVKDSSSEILVRRHFAGHAGRTKSKRMLCKFNLVIS